MRCGPAVHCTDAANNQSVWILHGGSAKTALQLGVYLGFQDSDVRETPVLLSKVQPIADDKLVGDFEGGVVNLHICDPPGPLVEKADDAQVPRLEGLDDGSEVRKGLCPCL